MDRNLIFALVLSALVLIFWSAVIAPRFTPPPKPEEPSASEEGDKDQTLTPAPEEPTKKTEPADEDESEPRKPHQEKEKEEGPAAPKAEKPQAVEGLPEAELQDQIETDVPGSPFLITWTNEGAALKRLTFRDYYTDTHHKENFTLLRRIEDAPLPFTLTHVMMLSGKDVSAPVEDGCELDLASRRYDVKKEGDNSLTFQTGYKNGLEISKTFAVEKGAYHVKAALRFRNAGAEQIKIQYRIAVCGGIVSEDLTGMYLYAATVTTDPFGKADVRKVQAGKLAKKAFVVEGKSVDIAWAGCDDKYFAALLHPEQETEHKIVCRASASGFTQSPPADDPKKTPIPNATMELVSFPVVIPPGGEVVHDYLYFVGPKEKDLLARQGHGELGGMNDFGMFGTVSKILLWILSGFHRMIPNYGWAIIFVTFVVKLVLHPLSRKTQISMHRMQKLQPFVNELKEKYKNDPKRMQMEQWDLFKKHRVNPLGGCLPMFIQIPVFLGLYRALDLSIVFRQAPFVLWIKDLSQPDRLVTWSTTVPLIGNEFNLLPILMTATWLIQQGTMPKPADPQQAQQQKIMMFMPVMFGFMLYSMASGLTLYWMVSTLLGIFEQAYIKKLIANMPDPKPLPDAPSKKSQRRRWR